MEDSFKLAELLLVQVNLVTSGQDGAGIAFRELKYLTSILRA